MHGHTDRGCSLNIWCRLPEILGTQMEPINAIAQELDIPTEYLGNSLEDGLFNE